LPEHRGRRAYSGQDNNKEIRGSMLEHGATFRWFVM
jgi:hypothetical protein